MPGIPVPFSSQVLEVRAVVGAEEHAGRRAGERSQAALPAEEHSERRSPEDDSTFRDAEED